MSGTNLSHDAPQPRNRKLRIAWSAAWAIVAVLLIALWVRSYWWADSFSYISVSSQILEVLSRAG